MSNASSTSLGVLVHGATLLMQDATAMSNASSTRRETSTPPTQSALPPLPPPKCPPPSQPKSSLPPLPPPSFPPPPEQPLQVNLSRREAPAGSPDKSRS